MRTHFSRPVKQALIFTILTFSNNLSFHSQHFALFIAYEFDSNWSLLKLIKENLRSTFFMGHPLYIRSRQNYFLMRNWIHIILSSLKINVIVVGDCRIILKAGKKDGILKQIFRLSAKSIDESWNFTRINMELTLLKMLPKISRQNLRSYQENVLMIPTMEPEGKLNKFYSN